MARIPTLSDGQPLTYEIINKIIEKLGSIKDPVDDQSQDIFVWGPDISPTAKDSARIISGQRDFTLKANDPAPNVTVQFKTRKGMGGKVFTKVPIVVATVVDPKKGGTADMATISIVETTTTEVTFNVRVLKASKSNISLTINYIAIGAGPKTD